MRRRTILLVLMCLLLSFGNSSVFAAIEPSPDAEINAENYRSATAKLTIADDKATASATIIGQQGKTTKTTIILYLQQYNDGKWINVNLDNWKNSGTVTCSITKSKSVSKGYKYRTKAVCKAYIGTKVETVTKYSSSVNFD